VREVSFTEGEGAATLGFLLNTGALDPREAIFEAAASGGWVLLDLHRERVSLEDTFRRLTHAEPSPSHKAVNG